jgi:hypothetical protein
VLKVAPLGGVAACLEIAGRIGMPVVVSSALESSVGLAAGVALAAALPDLPYACGLGTASMFGHDVTSNPLLAVGGAVRVGPCRPGRPGSRRGRRRPAGSAAVERPAGRRLGPGPVQPGPARMTSSTQLARLVVDELVRHGVREAVLAPGSRSAPAGPGAARR